MPRSSTEAIIIALRSLANDIQSGDGVANACCAEAADRLEEYHAAIAYVVVCKKIQACDVCYGVLREAIDGK